MGLHHALGRAGMLAVATLTVACNALVGDSGDFQLAPPDAGIDAPKVDCKVNPDFGIVASNAVTARLSHRTSDGGPSLLFLLNADAKPDALSVLLYDNMGGHGVLNAKGTFSLGATDAKLETCGICAEVLVDFDRTAATVAATYLATAQGTLTLTKADATGLTGRMQSLKLRHVEISGNVTHEVADGCAVTIGDVEFDLPYSP